MIPRPTRRLEEDKRRVNVFRSQSKWKWQSGTSQDIQTSLHPRCKTETMFDRCYSGKKPLASTGVKMISFNYVACERRIVSLWFDPRANQKTITSFRTSHDEVEYEVIGIQEYSNAEDNEIPLVLYVRLVLDAETSRCPPKRVNDFLLAITRRFTTSTLGADSGRCSLRYSPS